MRLPVITVWIGLAVATAAGWAVHPLWSLAGAAGFIGYGLVLDDEDGDR